MKQAWLAGSLGLVTALSVAPAALAASTATISGGDTVKVTSGSEGNTISVAYTQATNTYVVADATANVTKAGTCVEVDTHTVSCPGAGINQISVDTGNGTDTISLDPTTIPAGVAGNLDGGSGSDFIVGARGKDDINAGSGNDLINAGEGADDINGGSNTDTLFYVDRTTPLFVTVGSVNGNDGNELDLTGAFRDTVHSDVESIFGGTGGDVVIGDNSSETLDGGEGSDTLVGNGGGDALLGFGGDDLMSGGNGGDVARGGDGNDRLLGGPDGDRLLGGPGNDFLRGKKGSDVMKGKGEIDHIVAKDGARDIKINCGPGPNGLEGANRDKRLDPKPKSC